MATDAGRSAARLRVATSLARNLKASTLVASCRANGIRHITTGVAAAHALASISIPEDQLRTAPS